MSSTNRGRKNNRKGKKDKTSIQQPILPDVFDAPDECDCPSCSGADFDPRQLIDELIAGTVGLAGSEDPLDAEVVGAAFMSIGARAGEAFEEVLVGGFIPAFEARATTGALAMLLAIGSVAEGRAGKEALAAADRLAEAGIPRPRWAAELGEPVTVGDCWHLSDTRGTASVLACSFHRAGRSHAVVMSVDNLDCGAASGIIFLGADRLPEELEAMQANGRASGHEITKEALDAAEFRWQVEKALDARAVHDSDIPEDIPEPGINDLSADEDEDGLPDYPAMVVLVRARMNTLPPPNKPAAPHGDEGDGHVGLTALQMLTQLAENGGEPILPGRRTAVAELPAKRKKSDQLAPIYQIKVSLQGARPPIWRRLQIPADISLAQLHTVIQIAFDWYDSHMHVFETPYGEFGTANAELGHLPEAPVTLEQVAPGLKSKIRYTYDFGDDWEHDIVVEKVLDRSETATYPRCTGGRRAAPPEDCGGVWGYANLVETLNDPADPEHEDTLEWLGLDDAADFDPDTFDAEAVTEALSAMR